MKIIVIGSGFSGLEVSLRLQKKLKDSVEITVISKGKNFDFWPLAIKNFCSKTNSTVDLANFYSSKGIKLINKTVKNIDLDSKSVVLSNSKQPFDYLVVALDSVPNFDVLGSEKSLHCDSSSDIHEIKSRLNEVLQKPNDKNLTVVVCGGGLRGVSLIGELNDYLESNCDLLGIRRIDVKLVLLEKNPQILGKIQSSARLSASKYLSMLGVDVRTNNKVVEVKEGAVLLDDGSIDSGTIIWCGGLKPNPLIKDLGFSLDKSGFIVVNSQLQTKSDATIYAVGDCISEWNLRGSSSVWNQLNQAEVVAHNISTNVLDKSSKKDFKKSGSSLTFSIGSKDFAVINGKTVSGFAASKFKNLRENKWLSSKK